MHCAKERQRLLDEIAGIVRQEVFLLVGWMVQQQEVPPLQEVEAHALIFLGLDLLHGAVNLVDSGYQAEGLPCAWGAEEFERYQGKSVPPLLRPLNV